MRTMITYILIALTIITAPLGAECLSCIVPHKQHQPNGQVVEWIEKKCRKTQRYIKKGKKCSRCGCDRGSHTLHRDQFAYHSGKKVKAQHLGKVEMGDILPEVGQQA